MASSTLIAHSPKFESKLVTLPDLKVLPAPLAIGARHKPVAHHVLVEALLAEIDKRGYVPTKTQYALGHKGQALFGVIDLKSAHEDRSTALGFRNATDQTLAIQGVAGSHVFVCDNLALSGSTFAFKRKNTTGLDLGDVIATGFDKFLQHMEAFDLQIARLQGISLTNDKAKAVIYDVFAARVVPVRLFDDVNRFYFEASDATPDTQPRSLWGVQNAFTRAMKDLSPVRQFGATVDLGKALMPAILDGEIVQ